MNVLAHRRTRRCLVLAGSLLAAVLSCLAPAPALVTPETAAPPARTVRVYAFWNTEYLYLAARVPDTALTGTATDPMSAADQDDAVEFDLGSATGAYRLVISAAGGMTMLSRDAGGMWRSDNAWVRGPRTIKYAVKCVGTLNDPRDTDTEFITECALPWEFLGGLPEQNPQLGFNVAVHMQGESEGVVSWSPAVTSESELGDLSRWGRLLLATSSAHTVAEGALAVAPLQFVSPFIDGTLNADEWMTSGTLSLEKPAPSLRPAAATPTATRRAASTSLFAIYRYDWEPDRFWRPDGTPATVDQPKAAPGPWYDWRRVDWQRGQLDEVKRSGIDVLLVHYRGDAESRRTWACAGLDRLTHALKELRAEGRSYPLLGLYLDTESLRGTDLKSAAGRQQLYGMIRDFFLHVSPEFRAQLGAKPEQGLVGGVPVLLGEPEGLADWDASFQDFVAQHLAADFGERVTWLGSRAWRDKGATGFYATFHLSADALVQSSPDGASVFVISPGACPPPGEKGEVRARREGRAYRADWQRLLATGPDLVIINSWNDYAAGTDIAPSRQYGFEYGDTTRYFRARLGADQPRALRLLRASVPSVLRSGPDYTVEFVVENAGTEDISTSSVISVDYRITRRSDGQVLLQRNALMDLSVRAGQIKRLPVVIPTRDATARPLPPGDYVFSLVVLRTRVPFVRSKFVARPQAELSVPFTIGPPPARRFGLISTSLPSSLEAGATERVTVRVRNDGAETWRVKDTQLSFHGVRSATDLAAETSQARQVVAEGARAELPRDVAPGEVASVVILVRTVGADGAPLAVPQAGDAWSYRLQWNLVHGAQEWFPAEGALAEEAVQLVARENPAQWQSVSVPKSVEADSTFPATLVVANAGSRSWSAPATEVEGRWYRWDAREVRAPVAVAHLSADVEPARTLSLNVDTTAPHTPGAYWLVWRLRGPEGETAGRRRDLFVTPVVVRSARVRPLDLASLTNVVAAASDAYRSRGDMDGTGRCFPDECLPPDQTGGVNLYPSGYYAVAAADAEAASFAFPDPSSGMGGAVACNGQTLPLGEPGARRIYLLAASTEGAQQLTLALKHADGTTETAELRVPSWIERSAEARVAAFAPYLRSANGDRAETPGYLYELRVEPKSGAAVSLELPQNPAVKIVAVTVEGDPAPAAAQP